MKIPDLLPSDDKPDSVRRWRIRQALISCSAWGVIAFFILPALIGVPYSVPKLGQVAWASDTAGLKSELTDIKVQLLVQLIFAAQKEKCEQEKAGKYSPYWSDQLLKLRRDYWKLTGQAFELPPSC